MQTLVVDRTVSMSEFKKNPASVLRQAQNHPVAVLNHNKPAFYMVEPVFFEAMLNELADQRLHRLVLQRLCERSQAVEVDVDSL